MKIFNLPDLGEGLPDAEITEWHVAVGDEVKVDQLMVSVETAKAVIDIPSPYSGRIAVLYGKPNDIIQTGEPLVAFELDGADTQDVESDQPKDSGTVVGEIEVGDQVIKESPTGVQVSAEKPTGIKALPAVRALAKKLGVDLSKITPTGPHNSITAEDVREASHHDETTLVILRGVRRAMALNMSKVHQEVVPVTIMEDADIHHWSEKEDLTLRIISAIVKGCQVEPSINAHYDHESLTCQLFKEINIGIGVDTKDGLYVPVLKDVAQRDSTDLRSEINKFKAQAEKQAFKPEDLKEPTIMLTNYGIFAGRYATPIVVPPNVAIVGVGRARREAVAVKDKLEIHRVLPISLTVDHRALTGGESARFLAALIQDLEHR